MGGVPSAFCAGDGYLSDDALKTYVVQQDKACRLKSTEYGLRMNIDGWISIRNPASNQCRPCKSLL